MGNNGELMSLGPVMLDIGGTHLTAADEERLQHPLTGGVILFTRNYSSFEQLEQLTAEIHALRTPPLLIAVDHEGGRVQRFREGFTRLPPMRELGIIWDEHPASARHLAKAAGFILAGELRAAGIDFSFTPVLDMDYGQSTVIGDRAFHSQPQRNRRTGSPSDVGAETGRNGSRRKTFSGAWLYQGRFAYRTPGG